jgi:hypothetical protein
METSNNNIIKEDLVLEYKKRRYHVGDFWWHSPERMHINLSELKIDLTPVLVMEKAAVLVAKKIAELKSENNIANLLFVTLDYIVQNILQQPRDCIINYSTSIGLKRFNKEINETKDVWFIHFTPNDMISKPKDAALQVKAMGSLAKSLLELIKLIEDDTLIAPQYLLGITNLEMADFAQKYGFNTTEDIQRALIHQRIFRSKNRITKSYHQNSLRIHDATLNSVVYLKTDDLLSEGFREKLVKTIERSDMIYKRLITKKI